MSLDVESVATVTQLRSLGGDIVLGIVSGLVTGLLIYGFSRIWRRVLVPWYEERIYKGIDISGEWHVEHGPVHDGQDEWSQTEVLVVRQTAHRLDGTLTASPRPGEDGEVRMFTFSGEIADRFVWGRVRYGERNRMGHATMLLQVVRDGRRLEGQQVYFDVINDRIATDQLTYVRKKG